MTRSASSTVASVNLLISYWPAGGVESLYIFGFLGNIFSEIRKINLLYGSKINKSQRRVNFEPFRLAETSLRPTHSGLPIFFDNLIAFIAQGVNASNYKNLMCTLRALK